MASWSLRKSCGRSGTGSRTTTGQEPPSSSRENAVIEWPASRERLAGRDNIIAVNREYPEGWSIKVMRIIAEDDHVAAEVEVPHTELGLFRVAGFYTVRDDEILRGTEYWTTVGADEPPAGRARWVERY